MKIALAGNPNCGKTTLYNAMTGQTEQVGNWSGVTVESKKAPLKKMPDIENKDIIVVDLPGAYSISPYTSEEAVTRDFILKEHIDVIINIIDGANMSRSLFFTTQLLELGVPVVVALNKGDIIEKRGEKVNFTALENILNCKVIQTTATSGEGLVELVQEAIDLSQSQNKQISPSFEGKGTNDEDLLRQKFVESIVKDSILNKRDASHLQLSDRIDRIVAHRFIGLPIFFLIMWGVYSLSIEGIGGVLSGYLNDTFFGEIVPNAANEFFDNIGVNPLLKALIVDGAIGGVGAVIGFIPLIMVLFFCLALLEDSGYMARVAVVMNRYFAKIGLSGKSIIPMIVGSGCAIPGVMATRTIEDVHERRITAILTPFIPCGAKLPVIALFSVVFFPGSSWVGPSIYLLAIAVIIVGGLLLKKVFIWESHSHFIIELPEYRLPSLKYAVHQMFKQAKGFIYKASTIILVMNSLVWFMQAYGWGLQPVEDQSTSILASLGGVISPLFIPLGFVGWQLAAAAISGFIAKENVVSTLAVVLAVASEDTLHMVNGPLTGFFTPVTAYAFLVFNLFTPPCFAAVGAMRSELNSKKWLFQGLFFQFSVGYIVAMLITQIGTFVTTGSFANSIVPSIIILVVLVMLIFFRGKRISKIQGGMELSN